MEKLHQEVETLRQKLETLQDAYARTIAENRFLKQELAFRRRARASNSAPAVRLSAA